MGVEVETACGRDTKIGLAPWEWGLKLHVVRTLRQEVLHHGGEELKM